VCLCDVRACVRACKCVRACNVRVRVSAPQNFGGGRSSGSATIDHTRRVRNALRNADPHARRTRHGAARIRRGGPAVLHGQRGRRGRSGRAAVGRTRGGSARRGRTVPERAGGRAQACAHTHGGGGRPPHEPQKRTSAHETSALAGGCAGFVGPTGAGVGGPAHASDAITEAEIERRIDPRPRTQARPLHGMWARGLGAGSLATARACGSEPFYWSLAHEVPNDGRPSMRSREAVRLWRVAPARPGGSAWD
jgi:hypothetical protein